VEPSPEECVVPGAEDLENIDPETALTNNNNNNSAVPGIPEFWLTIFKNTDILSEMVQPHDEPILERLEDIRVSFPENMGFVLEFVFAPNEYFDNEVLTKSYLMKSEPEETDPVSFDGPEIIGSEGCTINWKTGKNITKKVVKKKQRQRGNDKVRWVTKTQKEDSFFNFFDPPEMPDDNESCDEELEALLTTDFEIGQYIRERIIPKAIWYFTNEVTDIESDMEDGDGDSDTTDSSDLSQDDDDENDNIVANNTATEVNPTESCQSHQTNS
jgi:nucleosome assembly protein 1-like 1